MQIATIMFQLLGDFVPQTNYWGPVPGYRCLPDSLFSIVIVCSRIFYLFLTFLRPQMNFHPRPARHNVRRLLCSRSVINIVPRAGCRAGIGSVGQANTRYLQRVTPNTLVIRQTRHNQPN